MNQKVRRNWTKQEDDFLREELGNYSVGKIAKKLNRTPKAIKLRAYRLKCGAHMMACDSIPLTHIVQSIYGYYSQSHCSEKISQWMRNGIPAKRHRINKNTFLVIRLENFWKWAEQHKELINFSRMEENALGIEPEWVKEKRRIDCMNPVRYKTRWTPYEDDMLRALLAEYSLSYFELAQRFNRSESAIKRRIYDLCLKSWPIRANPTRWTKNDVDILAQMYRDGYAMKLISQRLGRSEHSCRARLERLQRMQQDGKL